LPNYVEPADAALMRFQLLWTPWLQALLRRVRRRNGSDGPSILRSCSLNPNPGVWIKPTSGLQPSRRFCIKWSSAKILFHAGA